MLKSLGWRLEGSQFTNEWKGWILWLQLEDVCGERPQGRKPAVKLYFAEEFSKIQASVTKTCIKEEVMASYSLKYPCFRSYRKQKCVIRLWGNVAKRSSYKNKPFVSELIEFIMPLRLLRAVFLLSLLSGTCRYTQQTQSVIWWLICKVWYDLHLHVAEQDNKSQISLQEFHSSVISQYTVPAQRFPSALPKYSPPLLKCHEVL